MLLAKVDLLLHGSFHCIAAHANAAFVHFALADIQLLFDDWDALLAV